MVISRTTVQRLTSIEKETEEVMSSVSDFDTDISFCFKEEEDLTYDGSNPNPKDWYQYLKYDPEFQEEFNRIMNDSNVPEADVDLTPDVFDDTYLNTELAISRYGDRPEFDKVTKSLREKDGLPIGRAHNNPIMYTRMYEVEYKDRHKASLAVNAIAENMFAQSDGEGNWHILLLIPTTVIQPLRVQASIKVRTQTGNITELTSRLMP